LRDVSLVPDEKGMFMYFKIPSRMGTKLMIAGILFIYSGIVWSLKLFVEYRSIAVCAMATSKSFAPRMHFAVPMDPKMC